MSIDCKDQRRPDITALEAIRASAEQICASRAVPRSVSGQIASSVSRSGPLALCEPTRMAVDCIAGFQEPHLDPEFPDEHVSLRELN